MGHGYYGPKRDQTLYLMPDGPKLVTDGKQNYEYLARIREITFVYYCDTCEAQHAIPLHLVPDMLNGYAEEFSSSGCAVIGTVQNDMGD